MNHNQIRNLFISFFESKKHLKIPNSSLIPENDPTLMFINSGMAPLKSYFKGIQSPPNSRMVNIQRCVRTEDLENVGFTTRHLTFFEMLGSWSIGDYGKKEAIEFAFELLTLGFRLDKDRLYASVFAGSSEYGIEADLESENHWVACGISADHIIKLGVEDNFWSAGPVGPCGPCTEVFYDRGIEYGQGAKGIPGEDKERFLEIWNAGVFMVYNRTEAGNFETLPFLSVDTGAGLERFCMVMQGKDSVFDIDIFAGIISEITGKTQVTEQDKVWVNRIADHIRAVTFMISDGAMPNPNERGYVVRSLIRRSLVAARKLPFEVDIAKVADSVIREMSEIYPLLDATKELILTTLRSEASKFDSILHTGKKLITAYTPVSSGVFNPEYAFQLKDTYGVPLEVILELINERNLKLDLNRYEELEEEARLRSLNSSLVSKNAKNESSDEFARNHTGAHLLNEALRRVISTDIHQKGQDISSERLRFDFNFQRALTPQEVIAVEDEVNRIIRQNLPIEIVQTTFENAKSQGAQALFGEKYASVDKVTMYVIGDYSKELCGGPHVSNTSEMGNFKILKQESVGSGVRRIKAVVEGVN